MGAGTAEPGKGHSLESPCVAGSCCLWLLRDHLDYEGWMARGSYRPRVVRHPSCRQRLSHCWREGGTLFGPSCLESGCSGVVNGGWQMG